MRILRRLGRILLWSLFDDEQDEISLSDARERMLKVIKRETGKEASRADIEATCIEPGKVPIRVVRGFRSQKAQNQVMRPSEQEPTTDDLTAAFDSSNQPTRQDALAALSDVRVKCRAIGPEASDIESAVTVAIDQVLGIRTVTDKGGNDGFEVN